VLAGVQAQAIGIDPQPRLEHALGARMRLFTETSDAFFAGRDLRAELGGAAVELAFIDSMHLFEFALRDFMTSSGSARGRAPSCCTTAIRSTRRPARTSGAPRSGPETSGARWLR
jgi:hypothetical protein